MKRKKLFEKYCNYNIKKIYKRKNQVDINLRVFCTMGDQLQNIGWRFLRINSHVGSDL